MQIQILKRVKDKNGNILYFECLVDGVNRNLTFEQLSGFSDYVVNATVRGNNFKANDGFHIDTVIGQNYDVTPYRKKVIAPTVQSIDKDYWGSSTVNACRLIRKCAQCGNLVIDKSSHKSNPRSNLLLNCISDLGINLKDFIRWYLSNIHPYELELFESNNKGKSNIVVDKTKLWVRDICYKSYIVIKIHGIDSSKPIVISFHESDRMGKGSSVNYNLNSKPCAVVIDKILTNYGNSAEVSFKVCRGFQEYICTSYTSSFSDTLALVKYSTIEKQISDNVKEKFMRLAEFYYESDIDTEVFNSVSSLANDYRKFGFVAYGSNVINELSFLIDISTGLNTDNVTAIALDIASNIISEQSKDSKLLIENMLREKYSIENNFVGKLLYLLGS